MAEPGSLGMDRYGWGSRAVRFAILLLARSRRNECCADLVSAYMSSEPRQTHTSVFGSILSRSASRTGKQSGPRPFRSSRTLPNTTRLSNCLRNTADRPRIATGRRTRRTLTRKRRHKTTTDRGRSIVKASTRAISQEERTFLCRPPPTSKGHRRLRGCLRTGRASFRARASIRSRRRHDPNPSKSSLPTRALPRQPTINTNRIRGPRAGSIASWIS